MEAVLQSVERLVWGPPLLVLLIGSGLYLTVRYRFRPVLDLPKALGLVFRRQKKEQEKVSGFGALCTALSATVGTGNILGVAAALSLGGPGALLWMELSALTGLSLKYAEGRYAIRYRWKDGAGKPFGGPFAYISLGLGERFKPLAKAYALCGAMAGLFGVGTFVQIGSVSSCITWVWNRVQGGVSVIRLPWGRIVPVTAILAGLLFSLLAGRQIFGGIGRISKVSSVLVPMMGGLYVLLCLLILARYRARVPGILTEILRQGVRPEAAGAGLFGTIVAGVSRGVFSHEAGLGTAPIAAASAEDVTEEEQGLISMTAVFFDTFLICTLTGLVILAADTQKAGITGAVEAFLLGLPLPQAVSGVLILLVLSLFAFTTVLGWSFFGSSCLDYLTKGDKRVKKLYLACYVFTVFLAPLCAVNSVWRAANICNGLMAIPNLIGLLALYRKESGQKRSLS